MFNVTSFDLTPWQITNENPQHWSLQENGLVVQVEQGNMWGSGVSAVDNLFIHPYAKRLGDYSAQVSLNLVPQRSFEQAGIGIFWDDNNYIKISKEMFNNRLSLVFAVELEGFPTPHKIIDYPDSEVNLKLEKLNGAVIALFKTDAEKEWQRLGAVEALTGIEKGVMLYTFSGSLQQPNYAIFSNFNLHAL